MSSSSFVVKPCDAMLEASHDIVTNVWFYQQFTFSLFFFARILAHRYKINIYQNTKDK